MKVYIVFFVFLFISCSRTLEWEEISKCHSFSFQIQIDDSISIQPRMEYLFLRNKENSSKNYSFCRDFSEFSFCGSILGGEYFVFYYLLEQKENGKYSTCAYFVDALLVSEKNENDNKYQLFFVKHPFIYALYDKKSLRVKCDSSYDFLQVYNISAFSVKNSSGRNQSYSSRESDSQGNLWFYFDEILLEEDGVIGNLSYSIKTCCDKTFLAECGIQVTTTRLEKFDFSEILERK